ncbi:MAG TPA: antibiotic biosynthesis monooxygenase [Polyangia bacterium]|jgi:quinol monooxygenase YgiN
MNDRKLVLHGRLGAKDGKRDALAANLLRAAAAMESLPARRLYVVSTSESDPDGVWVTEIWDSAEDHAASLKRPETQQLIAETMPRIAALPERADKLALLGGKGPR